MTRVTSAVTEAFGKASAGNRAALVGYLPAGFPCVAGSIEAALALAQAGADVIEVGLPYSDPLMDGPVIAEAVHRALAAGTRVADVLRTVEAVAGAGVPVLVRTSWNPVDRSGVRAFAPCEPKGGVRLVLVAGEFTLVQGDYGNGLPFGWLGQGRVDSHRATRMRDTAS